MRGPDWLIARPIAHRGLHDISAGMIENTAPAFEAAIAGNYGIESDVQISADGEAMVHHDDALGRLTKGTARLDSLSAADIQRVPFKAGAANIMRLGELCDLVRGRVALLVELKSRFDGDIRIAKRAAEVLAGYRGPAALMSFDPCQVETAATIAPELPRGIIAERRYDHAEWDRLTAADKRRLAFLLHAGRTRPHFIAYAVRDLPAFAPLVAHWFFRRPLLTWTVRSKDDRARARCYADQVIFEGFRP